MKSLGDGNAARDGSVRAERHDPINHPSHYCLGGVEVIDAIEAWSLGYHLGNVVKYVARAAHKGAKLEDLKKARWYLDRAIAADEKGAK